MLPWVDGCWSSFVAWLCRWCWWCFWRCHWSSHGRRRRLWNACGRISASDATGGTRSLLTNIFVGVSPQRRNTVLPFTTFNPHIVTSFFIFFIQSSPALSSPVFGLLRPDSHVSSEPSAERRSARENARRNLFRQGPSRKAGGASVVLRR